MIHLFGVSVPTELFLLVVDVHGRDIIRADRMSEFMILETVGKVMESLSGGLTVQAAAEDAVCVLMLSYVTTIL